MNRHRIKQALPPHLDIARPSRWRLRAGLACVLLAPAVLLSACGGSSSSGSGTSASASAGSTPTQGGTIYYAHEMETPCLTGGWEQEGYVERQFLDNVVAESNGGKIVPWLATSWTVSPDHLTYTFHLKPGVKFTDGTPVNAQAIVDNLNYQVNPKTGNGVVSSYIVPAFKSATAVNDLTVQVKLKEPYAPFLGALAEPYAGIISPKTLTAGTTAVCDNPVGSGPFIFTKWNHGQNIEFVRNPNYNSWPANALHKGPAYVNKLVWSYILNPTTRYGSLTSGESDVIYDVPAPDYKAAQSQYNVAQSILGGRPNSIDLNAEHGVFTDVRVRQAFAYGANRKQAVESAFDGKLPFNGNGSLGYDSVDYDSSLNNAFAYDPAKANQLLNEAGWTGRNSEGYRTKDGKVLTAKVVYVPGSLIPEEGVTMLQDLQQQWKQVGFDVQLTPKTLAQAWGGELSKPTTYDAFASSEWCSYTPAILNIIWRYWDSKTEPNASNNSFYDNAKLVNLIQTADASYDPTVQNTNYTKAQEIVVNQALELGAYSQATSLAWTKDLHDVWIAPAQSEPIFADAYFTK
jgi:peptide/nickel transport system substrate-binding protein